MSTVINYSPAPSGTNGRCGSTAPVPEERLLRLPVVMRQTGLARSTIYSYVKNGTFPKPVKIGLNSSAWVAAEISGWVSDRILARNTAGGTQ